MQDCPRACQRFCDISVSERILNSLFLLTIAIGYFFSLGQIYFTHQGRDGKPGLSIEDVAIAYHGSPDQARLAAAIKGPMAGNLKSPADKAMILDWIASGAQREVYDSKIAPVLQRDCLGCHSPASGMNVPPLTSYEQVVKLTEADQGAPIPSLVRISHIHLFGIAFILFFVGKLFIYCEMPVWLKRLTIGIPFLSMLVDIFAWYLTRKAPAMAYLLVVSGALMGLSLNFQIWLSLYQMWLPVSYYRDFLATLKNRYIELRDFMIYSEQSVRFRKMLRQAGLAACAYLGNKVASWLTRENIVKQGGKLMLICQNGTRRWREICRVMVKA